MFSRLAMALFGFGLIFLSFGFVVFVIESVGKRYGAHHASAGKVMLGFLLAGAVLAGAGLLVNRSRGTSRSNS
jgi:hypothetical protein